MMDDSQGDANVEHNVRTAVVHSTNATSGRLFAIIPSAGQSRRMRQSNNSNETGSTSVNSENNVNEIDSSSGRANVNETIAALQESKLLLPLDGVPVIARVLRVLDHPAISKRCVVVRSSDVRLASVAKEAGGDVIIPNADPPDMKGSAFCAIEWLQENACPLDKDGWILIPGDHPVLDTTLIQALIHHWQTTSPKILVPKVGQRRGHPTLFRWEYAKKIHQIPSNAGLNWLLKHFAHDVEEFPWEDEGVLTDLDTPQDYQRLLHRNGSFGFSG